MNGSSHSMADSPGDVSLLPEIFARAARMHEGVAGGKIRFPAILQAYREVLLERGLNPQEDRLHIKYLLELKLSAGNDWWEKLSRVSGFKQGVKDATPLGTPPNATLEMKQSRSDDTPSSASGLPNGYSTNHSGSLEGEFSAIMHWNRNATRRAVAAWRDWTKTQQAWKREKDHNYVKMHIVRIRSVVRAWKALGRSRLGRELKATTQSKTTKLRAAFGAMRTMLNSREKQRDLVALVDKRYERLNRKKLLAAWRLARVHAVRIREFKGKWATPKLLRLSWGRWLTACSQMDTMRSLADSHRSRRAQASSIAAWRVLLQACCKGRRSRVKRWVRLWRHAATTAAARRRTRTKSCDSRRLPAGGVITTSTTRRRRRRTMKRHLPATTIRQQQQQQPQQPLPGQFIACVFAWVSRSFEADSNPQLLLHAAQRYLLVPTDTSSHAALVKAAGGIRWKASCAEDLKVSCERHTQWQLGHVLRRWGRVVRLQRCHRMVIYRKMRRVFIVRKVAEASAIVHCNRELSRRAFAQWVRRFKTRCAARQLGRLQERRKKHVSFQIWRVCFMVQHNHSKIKQRAVLRRLAANSRQRRQARMMLQEAKRVNVQLAIRQAIGKLRVNMVTNRLKGFLTYKSRQRKLRFVCSPILREWSDLLATRRQQNILEARLRSLACHRALKTWRTNAQSLHLEQAVRMEIMESRRLRILDSVLQGWRSTMALRNKARLIRESAEANLQRRVMLEWVGYHSSRVSAERRSLRELWERRRKPSISKAFSQWVAALARRRELRDRADAHYKAATLSYARRSIKSWESVAIRCRKVRRALEIYRHSWARNQRARFLQNLRGLQEKERLLSERLLQQQRSLPTGYYRRLLDGCLRGWQHAAAARRRDWEERLQLSTARLDYRRISRAFQTLSRAAALTRSRRAVEHVRIGRHLGWWRSWSQLTRLEKMREQSVGLHRRWTSSLRQSLLFSSWRAMATSRRTARGRIDAMLRISRCSRLRAAIGALREEVNACRMAQQLRQKATAHQATNLQRRALCQWRGMFALEVRVQVFSKKWVLQNSHDVFMQWFRMALVKSARRRVVEASNRRIKELRTHGICRRALAAWVRISRRIVSGRRDASLWRQSRIASAWRTLVTSRQQFKESEESATLLSAAARVRSAIAFLRSRVALRKGALLAASRALAFRRQFACQRALHRLTESATSGRRVAQLRTSTHHRRMRQAFAIWVAENDGRRRIASARRRFRVTRCKEAIKAWRKTTEIGLRERHRVRKLQDLLKRLQLREFVRKLRELVLEDRRVVDAGRAVSRRFLTLKCWVPWRASARACLIGKKATLRKGKTALQRVWTAWRTIGEEALMVAAYEKQARKKLFLRVWRKTLERNNRLSALSATLSRERRGKMALRALLQWQGVKHRVEADRYRQNAIYVQVRASLRFWLQESRISSLANGAQALSNRARVVSVLHGWRCFSRERRIGNLANAVMMKKVQKFLRHQNISYWRLVAKERKLRRSSAVRSVLSALKRWQSRGKSRKELIAVHNQRQVRHAWQSWRATSQRNEAATSLLFAHRAGSAFSAWLEASAPARRAAAKMQLIGEQLSADSRGLRMAWRTWRRRLMRRQRFIESANAVAERVRELDPQAREWVHDRLASLIPSRRLKSAFTALRQHTRDMKEEGRLGAIADAHYRRSNIIRFLVGRLGDRRCRTRETVQALRHWAKGTAARAVQTWQARCRMYRALEEAKTGVVDARIQRILENVLNQWHRRFKGRRARRVVFARASNMYLGNVAQKAINVWRLQLAVKQKYKPIIIRLHRVREVHLRATVMAKWWERAKAKIERRRMLQQAMKDVRRDILKKAFKGWTMIAEDGREQRNRQLIFRCYSTWKLRARAISLQRLSVFNNAEQEMGGSARLPEGFLHFKEGVRRHYVAKHF